MKKVKLIFTLILASLIGFSQAPNLINYQGVALNIGGTPIANQTINIRASIHDVTASGTVVFSEDRTVTTDVTGLFDIQIGSAGSVNNFGTLNNVSWHTAPKFLKIKMDPTGGLNFIDMGTQQLVSVPYALNAKTASALTPNAVVDLSNISTTGVTTNQVLQYNGTTWAPANVNITPFSLPYAAIDATNGNSLSIQNTSNVSGVAIRGTATGNNGVGVYGTASGTGYGVQAQSSNMGGRAIKATHTTNGVAIEATTGTGYAVLGECTGANGSAIVGKANGTSTSSRGVFGESSNGTGVVGYGNNTGSIGVSGSSLDGTGVKAYSFTGTALDVDGNVKIAGGNTNPSHGAVLTSDANGNATWKNNRVAFKADLSSQTIADGIFTLAILNQVYDLGNNFNPTSSAVDPNTFIAPVSGYYSFSGKMRGALSSNINNISYCSYRFSINGSINGYEHSSHGVYSTSFGSYCDTEGSEEIHLNAGDKVTLQLSQQSGGNSSIEIWDGQFSGYLMFAD